MLDRLFRRPRVSKCLVRPATSAAGNRRPWIGDAFRRMDEIILGSLPDLSSCSDILLAKKRRPVGAGRQTIRKPSVFVPFFRYPFRKVHRGEGGAPIGHLFEIASSDGTKFGIYLLKARLDRLKALVARPDLPLD
jgi:hypothetical protein